MKLFRAQILNPISDTECQYFADAALLVDGKGKILACSEYADLVTSKYAALAKQAELINLEGKLIMPCFADIHFHWVQDDVCTMPKARLITWLEAYTWPSEAKFDNPLFSKIKAEFFARKILSLGTTIGAVYSSIHEHAVVDILRELQGEFFVGAVSMTKDSPAYLLEDEFESFEKNKRLLGRFKERYVITPRFAPSCTDQTLQDLGSLAKAHSAWVQTHLAETRDKHESDYEILERNNLLGSKTILGHCIYLDDTGLETLARTQSKIAHCPSSNAPIEKLGLGSGLFDFARAEDAGVDWALASDIGAGPYLSMFDVMKSFLEQNSLVGNSAATAVKALYRATVKGAEILELENKGNLTVGKDADFIVLGKPSVPAETFDGELEAELILSAILSQNRVSFETVVQQVYLAAEQKFEQKA